MLSSSSIGASSSNNLGLFSGAGVAMIILSSLMNNELLVVVRMNGLVLVEADR